MHYCYYDNMYSVGMEYSLLGYYGGEKREKWKWDASHPVFLDTIFLKMRRMEQTGGL